MKKLTGELFIVTGCTGGIGNAVCSCLRSEGAFIIGINRNKGKRSAYVQEQLSGDLGSPGEAENIFRMIVAGYGPPRCLVYCSGALIPGSFDSLSNDELKSVIDANLLSLYNVIRAVQPGMQKNGNGHIVVIGSLGGIVPMPYSALYSSMKFAVRGFCLSIAAELKEKGISVSLISPGPVDTTMLETESLDKNSVISFIQKPLLPGQIAKKILYVIQKPSLETVIPKSGSIAVLLFNLFPGVFYRFFTRMKKRGGRGMEIYRKSLLARTTG